MVIFRRSVEVFCGALLAILVQQAPAQAYFNPGKEADLSKSSWVNLPGNCPMVGGQEVSGQGIYDRFTAIFEGGQLALYGNIHGANVGIKTILKDQQGNVIVDDCTSWKNSGHSVRVTREQLASGYTLTVWTAVLSRY